MKVTKQNVVVYQLRELGRGGWADITIDEGEKSGRISIASDWGNWSNYWGACGESFIDFICDLDIHYFAGKVGMNRWIDADATMRSWKRQVLEARRREDIEADEAKEIYIEFMELQDCSGRELITAAYEKEYIGKFFEYQMDTIYDIDPSFKSFWEHAYLPFIEYLKANKAQLA